MKFTDYFNKPKFTYNIPESHTFKSLKHLVGEYGIEKVHTVKGMYISRTGKFGAQPVIITDKELVNAPVHLLKQVETIMDNASLVDLINNNRAGFVIYEYENDYGKQYSLKWTNI